MIIQLTECFNHLEKSWATRNEKLFSLYNGILIWLRGTENIIKALQKLLNFKDRSYLCFLKQYQHLVRKKFQKPKVITFKT